MGLVIAATLRDGGAIGWLYHQYGVRSGVTILKKTKTKFRSNFEERISKELTKARVKFKYESEAIPYVRAHHYFPDFIITTPRGKIYVECKGYLRPNDRAKMAAVIRQHPNLDIRFVFYRESETNIRWATRLGIKYSIGSVPKEWLI